MLLHEKEDGTLNNMHLSKYHELVLLFAEINFPKDQNAHNATIKVTYRPPHADSKTMTVPLIPETNELEEIDVNMHGSPTRAYRMQDQYNTWLSTCLGYKVILAYLGNNNRAVLGSTQLQSPSPQNNSWFSSLTSKLPNLLSTTPEPVEAITFADCAPFLVVNETSLNDVSNRLPDDQEMDITKFRPNIIVAGAPEEWEEDYWTELQTASGVTLRLVHNCARCASLNIDYATGKQGTDESGKILKLLQRDRRVDVGMKYSPVFGRYSFLGKGCEGKVLSVGDEVTVTGRSEERTTFGKFASGNDGD